MVVRQDVAMVFFLRFRISQFFPNDSATHAKVDEPFVDPRSYPGEFDATLLFWVPPAY
jgi:hypothetical protein